MPINMWIVSLLLLSAALSPALAEPSPCAVADTKCLIEDLMTTAKTIPEDNWRDQTWRETAKTAAANNQIDQALKIIPLIKNPDTKAMTIRGIGMALADLDLTPPQRKEIFTALRAEADNIEHAPSHAIALTYIAMSQAFAGDNQDAMATAASMTNAALRNKAYGEAAEILAEHDNLQDALLNLAAIDDPGYKDKQQGLVVKKFSDIKSYASALTVANGIANPYERAQALIYILGKQAQENRNITPSQIETAE